MDPEGESSKRESESNVSTNVPTENGGASSPVKRQKVSDDKPEANPTNELPVHEVVGGSSVRQYLNKHLTQHILEGLRAVSNNKPEDPLRWLGEFLIERSNQISNGELDTARERNSDASMNEGSTIGSSVKLEQPE